MSETIYKTNVDGRGNVKGDETLLKDDLVMINDSIYNDDKEVFKVGKVNGTNVEMKLVKSLVLTPDLENVEGFNDKYNIDGVEGTYLAPNRVSKNQTLVVNNDVFLVTDIEKRKGEPNLIKVERPNIKKLKSFYPIFFRTKDSREEKIYTVLEDYGSAIIELARLRREKSNEGYFRFI